MTVRELPLRRRPGWIALVCGCLTLSALSITMVLLAPRLDPALHPWRLYVDVLIEDNLPTWWSAALLAVAALAHVLTGVAGRAAKAPGASCWLVSAAVLAGLSLDDHTQLHERTEAIGRQLVIPGTYPFYWLIPGAIAGVAIVAALSLLAVRVRGATRWLLVAAVTVLLGCALGLETVQGLFMQDRNENLGFALTYHIEELGENVAALLMLAAASSALSITRDDGGLAVSYRG